MASRTYSSTTENALSFFSTLFTSEGRITESRGSKADLKLQTDSLEGDSPSNTLAPCLGPKSALWIVPSDRQVTRRGRHEPGKWRFVRFVKSYDLWGSWCGTACKSTFSSYTVQEWGPSLQKIFKGFLLNAFSKPYCLGHMGTKGGSSGTGTCKSQLKGTVDPLNAFS